MYLTALAHDGCVCILQVRVTVDDVNDNPPRFALPELAVRVLEDVPPGSVIAVVQASDPDLSLGGEVRYSLRHPDEDPDVEQLWFRIDPITGTVRTLRELDYEERQVTHTPQHSGSCSLVI